jgi:hypothetical protein
VKWQYLRPEYTLVQAADMSEGKVLVTCIVFMFRLLLLLRRVKLQFISLSTLTYLLDRNNIEDERYNMNVIQVNQE